MKSPVPGWKAITATRPVHIPRADGEGIAETIHVKVPAWQDSVSGEIFLDGHATEKLDAAKARYLGLLTPGQLREMRDAIGISQKGMAELLQLGEKSWTRWETGKERPSRSMNVLLCALFDGRLDVNYLRSLADPNMRSQFKRWKPAVRSKRSHVAEPKSEYGAKKKSARRESNAERGQSARKRSTIKSDLF